MSSTSPEARALGPRIPSTVLYHIRLPRRLNVLNDHTRNNENIVKYVQRELNALQIALALCQSVCKLSSLRQKVYTKTKHENQESIIILKLTVIVSFIKKISECKFNHKELAVRTILYSRIRKCQGSFPQETHVLLFPF